MAELGSTKARRTNFEVAFFREDDDTKAFAIMPATAKMPLGALAFTLPQVEGQKAGRVEVSDNGTVVRTFYHVEIQGTQLKYDNPVLVEDAE